MKGDWLVASTGDTFLNKLANYILRTDNPELAMNYGHHELWTSMEVVEMFSQEEEFNESSVAWEEDGVLLFWGQ